MLEEYPKTLKLQNGCECILRPMVMEDHDALYRYFISLPEKIRKYLRNDVTNRVLIEKWCREIDYNKVLPILALGNEKIVGSASLLREGSGSMSHIGEIRMTFDHEFYEKGIGSVLVDEISMLAKKAGYEKLIIKIVSSRVLLIKLFEEKNFTAVATLKNFVKNIYDKDYRDILIMEKDLIIGHD